MIMRSVSLALSLLLSLGPTFAQTDRDILAATSPADEALTGPLHTVTVIAPDIDPLTTLFAQGMGMTRMGPVKPVPATSDMERTLWGLPDDLNWEVYSFSRPNVPRTIKVRIIVTDSATPSIRQSWDRQELGPYGLGFPTLDVFAWDNHLRSLGFERATPEVEVFDVSRPDGAIYPVHESALYGPEFLRIIAISRKGDLPQVGVYDETTGRGGPAYSTQIVPDADAMIGFLTKVLDMEVRSDRTWREYAVPFRFATVHAKGAETGHVALVEYEESDLLPGTNVAPRPPNRGLVMWSFPAGDLDAVLARANVADFEVFAGPDTYQSLSDGRRRAATFIAPNGFLVEVFEDVP